MARPDEEKGEPSSPCSPTSPNEKRALQQKDSPPEWRERQLYLREFAMLRCIQRSTPRFVLPLALFVHRLASQVLLIPLVGIFTWAVDMPAAASTSTCACFCVSLNSGLKWIWQRPRPLWLDNGKVSEVWNIGAVFEGDYSFPSGHAHSLSGVILCAFFTFKLELHWLPLFLLLTALIALTRNYLGVHWCSDTLTGWAIGSLSGVLWGLLDPYELLLRRQDPWLSMAWGFTFAVSLVGLAALGLMLTTPVQASVRAEWLATAVQGLDTRVAPADEAPEAPRCLPQKPRELRARHLAYAAGPAVCGGMLLGLTGLYRDLPRHLLYCLEMRPPPHVAALRVLVGLLGSGLIMSFLALPLYFVRDVSLEEGTTPRATGKAMLLMLPLALAPWWVFLLSQLLLEELGLGCRPPGLPGPPGPPGPP